MSVIRLLEPRLANQIAAGEVVERPSSVVKEAVENSLDAGAMRIDIDVEAGGTRLLRIRDNGAGISEADIALSLARPCDQQNRFYRRSGGSGIARLSRRSISLDRLRFHG
jgi:DNA mismatch repair ATPase MutL